MNTHGMTPISGTPGNYVTSGWTPNSATETSEQAEYKGREVICAVSQSKRLRPAFCRGSSRNVVLSGGRPAAVPCSLALLVAAFSLFAMSPKTMAQCTNEISPTTRQHGHGATTNSVSVDVSPTSCSWSVQNTNPWITITAAFSSGAGLVTQPPYGGTGTGYVAYAIEPNPSIVGRTGVVTIANQSYTIRQLGVPCTFTLSPTNRIHGAGNATNTVSIRASSQQCPWMATTTNSWLRIVPPVQATGDAELTYEVSQNVLAMWRTGAVHVAGEVLTIIQRPSSCWYLLEPTNYTRAHGYGAATNQIFVNAPVSCPWTAEKSDSWITIVFGGSGMGDGTIRYSITPNPASYPRAATITVVDQVFTITQAGAPCAYSLSPSNRLHSFHAQTAQFAINTPLGCPWSIRNTNSWIEVLTDTNGVGPANVVYSINANPNLSDRTGHLMLMADGTNVTTFRVRQERAICTYRVSPATRNHGYSGSSNIFTVTVSSNGCSWTIVNDTDWITTYRNGNTVGYVVAPNPYPVQRAAVLEVGNTNFGAPDTIVVTQNAFPCAYELSPRATSRGFGAATGTVKVITTSTCPWTASSSNDWISVSPSQGVGSNNLTYAIARNHAAIERVGYVTIIGSETNLSLVITQAAANCTYSISPSGRTHGYGAVTAEVRVVAVTGCPWTVINTNPWVAIHSALNGSGSNNVTYALEPNTSGIQRAGVITIVPQSGSPLNFTVAQLAVSCTYDLSPTQLFHDSGSETGSVSVTTSSICQWDVVNTNSWISILSGVSGTGNGTVIYAVSSNLNITARSGILTIDGQTVAINQAAYTCTFKFTPRDRTNGHGNATGVVSIATGVNCPWTLNNTNDWVTITGVSSTTGLDTTPPFTGTGNGTFTYAISANPYPQPRMGYIGVGNESEPFALTQRGMPCDVDVTPTTRPHGYGASTGLVAVASNCPWTLSNTNEWISITAINDPDSFAYDIQANPNPVPRTGYVIVTTGDSTALFTINQAAVTCDYDLSPPVRNHGHGATTGSVDITTSGGCSWTIDNTNQWVTILQASGLGTEQVFYALQANTNLTGRTGYITITGSDANPQPTLVLTINQQAAVCTYSISPTERTHGFGGSTGDVRVTTLLTCTWLVINTNDWIRITSPIPSGGINGSGSIAYTVTNNSVPVARTGVVQIADQYLTIVQRSSTDGPPFAFQTVERDPAGDVRLRLGGAPAGVWRIETSSNLVTWSQLALVTNVTGVVDYLHPHTPQAPKLFYRAILQP